MYLLLNVQGGVMGYSLVAISMMILYALALIYREIFSKVLSVRVNITLHICISSFSYVDSWMSKKLVQIRSGGFSIVRSSWILAARDWKPLDDA